MVKVLWGDFQKAVSDIKNLIVFTCQINIPFGSAKTNHRKQLDVFSGFMFLKLMGFLHRLRTFQV